MSSSLSQAAAQAYLNILRGVDLLGFSPDLALFLEDPRLGGAEVSTVGTAYARQPITFAAPVGQTMVNSNTITFPVATVGWGIIGFAAVMNGSVAWDVQAINETEENRTINAGSPPVAFAPGAILVRGT